MPCSLNSGLAANGAPWPTGWTYFRRWRNDGTWERIHTRLRAVVHPATIPARAGIPLVLARASEEVPRIQLIGVDPGYPGTGKAWIEEQLG